MYAVWRLLWEKACAYAPTINPSKTSGLAHYPERIKETENAGVRYQSGSFLNCAEGPSHFSC